jgi:LSD1 subclass zinc finger protein
MATTAPDVRVFPCPRCGAPLPAAADGAHVTCTACGATTTVETGGAAALAERASREEAEALFATLGEPPSWSQRVAVVLANPWLWLLLLPFALATLVRVAMVIQEAIAVAWERATGDRLMHVAAPPVQWLLSMGLVAAVALLLLVWSLLGKRVDARRELQAALACKPPETPGGPSGCRHCGAPLTVPPGALGVRCAYCGADNLVLLPAKWVDRAERATVALRLTAEAARERDAEGRRRVRGAALWRAPLVLGLIALTVLPAIRPRHASAFHDIALEGARRAGVFFLGQHRQGDLPSVDLRPIADCDDAASVRALRPGTQLRADESGVCEGGRCMLGALFPLPRGAELRLRWVKVEPGARARLELGSRSYQGESFLHAFLGEEVGAAALAGKAPGDLAFSARAKVGGYHRLELVGPADTEVEVCATRGAKR